MSDELQYPVNIPDGVSGDFKVTKVSATVLYQFIGDKWMNIMEDTDREAQQATRFLSAATGDVLLAGLGLGMVLQPLIDNQNVSSITVIEKFQEVIDLVSAHVPESNKIRIIKDDIYTWTPDKNYDVAWFDSYVYPFDGDDPVGSYVTNMRNKYQSVVSSGHFWPGSSVTTGHVGW